MTEQELARRIAKHNTQQILTAVVLAPASAVMWVVSFFVFFFPFLFILWMVGISAAFSIAVTIALGGIALLVREAWRRDRLLRAKGVLTSEDNPDFSTLKEISATVDHSSIGGGTTSSGAGGEGNIGHDAILLAHVLYVAPHAAAHAIHAIRSRLSTESRVIARAARILTQLEETREWTPASRFAGDGAALMLLDKMEYIWSESRDGEIYVRDDPAGRD